MLFLIIYNYVGYGMSKKQYRSEIGIMGDILDVTADAGYNGALVSQITRCANLSYYAALEKCDKLTTAGLVQFRQNGRNKTFSITHKGRQFARELDKFRDLADSLNLRY